MKNRAMNLNSFVCKCFDAETSNALCKRKKPIFVFASTDRKKRIDFQSNDHVKEAPNKYTNLFVINFQRKTFFSPIENAFFAQPGERSQIHAITFFRLLSHTRRW